MIILHIGPELQEEAQASRFSLQVLADLFQLVLGRSGSRTVHQGCGLAGGAIRDLLLQRIVEGPIEGISNEVEACHYIEVHPGLKISCLTCFLLDAEFISDDIDRDLGDQGADRPLIRARGVIDDDFSQDFGHQRTR